MNQNVAIIGVGYTGFQPTSTHSSYKEMIYKAALMAYNDAKVDPRNDIQSFVTVSEDFHEGTSIFDEYTPDQLGAALKPVHTIAGDGLHGLITAYMLIRTGQFDIVAVEGHSKASNILTLDGITAYAQDPVYNRPLQFNSHFIAGLEMNRYLHESKTTIEQCGLISCKNHSNALINPEAAYGSNLTLQDVINSPVLSWPITKLQVAEHADGALVFVLASEKVTGKISTNSVWMRGVGWINDSPSLESRTWGKLPHLSKAAAMAYRQAGISNPQKSIDFAEIDDTYAYKEIQSFEALGLCVEGEAGILTEQGYTSSQGELPVNVSGGTLGIGNLLDATGLCKALEIVLQLRGIAGSRQLSNIKIGLAQSWRGIPTTSCAVVILSKD